MKRSLRARLVSVCSIAALAIGMTIAFTGGVASAEAASDPRATFVNENIGDDCADAGLPADDLQIGAQGNGSDSDENLSGEVVENDGDINPGQGEELNVTIESDANVVIDGVVVKAGSAYNLYSDPSVLPPALDPPQHYIGPFVGAQNNVPQISHWFVCYHLAASISVEKVVVPLASGVTGVTLPDSYSAEVVCDDGTDVVVTLPGAGGAGTPSSIPVDDGAVCTVTETTALPTGSAVTYDPAEANTTGVTADIDTPVTVTITNDFSAVESTAVTTPVTPAAPLVAQARFTG
jgi:Domain of unknown function (DUF5979)